MSFRYEKEYTAEISFPLGGIGSGSIGISGTGRLIDWEILNRPNKNSVNGFSHIAVKAIKDGRVVDARVLNGDWVGEMTGKYDMDGFEAYGLGVRREYMAGFPHFKKCVFEGKYPIAKLKFSDKNFPGKVTLTAFNPLIPHKSTESSIPAAFFEINVENNTCDNYEYAVCFSVNNPFEGYNSFEKSDDVSYITMRDKTGINDLTIAAPYDAQYQEYWYRGAWSDGLEIFWREFEEKTDLKPRSYGTAGKNDMCSLAVKRKADAGESESVRFVLSWNVPDCINYWKPYKRNGKDVSWKNYYAVIFENSISSAKFALKNFTDLYRQSKSFVDAIFSISAPDFVKEAVTATLSVLKSPVVMRLEDGSFYGWEGVMKKIGSCEGTCTHVWSYAYALAFLFPDLERSMRDLDYKYNMDKNGKMQFRLELPPGRKRGDFHACLDGQMCGIIKTYRDYKLCGDRAWLAGKWKKLKRAMAYAWSGANEDKWDADMDGVLEGRQHHTLDMELFGPSSWLQGLYVCALKAMYEMAKIMKDGDADTYSDLYIKGKKFLNTELFNGEYYFQKIDINDKNLLIPYEDAAEKYWNEECSQIKYQIGGGCEIDQALAQWHSALCGLGEIYDKSKIKSALSALYKNNFKQNMRNFYNPWRVFCVDDERGAVMCDYPEGAVKPIVPLPYCQETMHGFEYALAGLMIEEGMAEQGFEIVKAIRDRYDGKHRNPWNEIECGSNYARSMAVFALVIILSGFSYDLDKGYIGFSPKVDTSNGFAGFWSAGDGYGKYIQKAGECRLKVIGGSLKIEAFSSPIPMQDAQVYCDGVKVGHNGVMFDREIEIKKELCVKACAANGGQDSVCD